MRAIISLVELTTKKEFVVNAGQEAQEALVEAISQSLWDATCHNQDHLATLTELASELLISLGGGPIRAHLKHGNLVALSVVRPIMMFIGRDKFETRYAEAQYLELKVLEKVIEFISAKVTVAYGQFVASQLPLHKQLPV